MNQETGVIEDSYSTGDVSGYSLGGLLKENKGSIKNSYTISKISGTSDYGRGFVVNWSGGTIQNSYWNKEYAGVETSDGGTELTLEQMKTQASYEGWDFTNTWKMGESGFPELVFNFGKIE